MIFEIASAVGFGLTQAADGVTTYLGLKRGGAEANSFVWMKFLAKHPTALLLTKIAIGIAIPVYEFRSPYLPGFIAMAAVAAVTGYVAFRNAQRLVKGHN